MLFIGEGKFSVVFKAFKVSDNTPVALKILKVTKIRIIHNFLRIDFWYEWLKIAWEMYERGKTIGKIKPWLHNLIYWELYRAKRNVYSSRVGRKRRFEAIGSLSCCKAIVPGRKESVDLPLVNSLSLKAHVLSQNNA